MRSILFIAKNFLPIAGGVQEHVYHVSRELRSQGWAIDVAFFWGKKRSECPLTEAGVHVLPWAGAWQRIRALIRLSHLIRSADIIHLHDYTAFYYSLPALLFAKLLRKPIFITFHGWEGQYPPAKLTVALRRFCNWICNGAINVGHYIEKWYGTTPDFVIYGATHDETREQPKSALRVAFLGRLDPDTDILMVLEAWKLVVKKYPTATLDVMGDGKLSSCASELVRNQNIPGVNFKGWIKDPGADLSSYNVVIPVGYLAMLLAFACECAVVTCYGNPLKRDYFCMIPDFDRMAWAGKDASEVAEAIEGVFLGSEKAKVAKKFADSCTWTAISDVYQQLWMKYGPLN